MQDGRIELSKVEFYIDDILRNTDTYPPYEWHWDEVAFGNHELKVIAYDNEGNIASDDISIWKVF